MPKPWPMSIVPRNSYAWAICYDDARGSRHVRRVVWGRLLAREEKRPGEYIRRCQIMTRF